MKPKMDSWTIVIPGFWNRMIFSPKWVIEALFHKSEAEKLVPILPIAPLIYRDADLVLQVDEQRVLVQARRTDISCLKKAEEMACEILSALPKTPVTAIGVNFGYTDTNPSDRLLELFNFDDDSDIGGLDWSIPLKKIVRRLEKEDFTLNLTLAYEMPQKLDFDANFHFSINTADDAIAKITTRTDKMHTELLDLLKTAYRISEDEEEIQ